MASSEYNLSVTEAANAYKLTVVDGTELTLNINAGAQGPAGPAGPAGTVEDIGKLTANTTVTIPLISDTTGEPITAAEVLSIMNSYPKDLNGFQLAFQFEEGHYTLDTTGLLYDQIGLFNFYGGQFKVRGYYPSGSSGNAYINSVRQRTVITFTHKGFLFVTQAKVDVDGILFENKSASSPVLRFDNNTWTKINGCAFYQALTDKNGATLTPTDGHTLFDNFVSENVWLYGCVFGKSYYGLAASRNAQVFLQDCKSMDKLTGTAKVPWFLSVNDPSAIELNQIINDSTKNKPQYFLRAEDGGYVSTQGTNYSGVLGQYKVDTESILANTTVNTVSAQTISGVKTFSDAPIVPTPTAATEAATKQYVDDKADPAPVRAFIKTNLADLIGGGANVTYSVISGGQFTSSVDVDWATLLEDPNLTVGVESSASRVLVTGQNVPLRNGIYYFLSSKILRRASDYNASSEITVGDSVFVTHGPYAKTEWKLHEFDGVLGTSAINFVQTSVDLVSDQTINGSKTFTGQTELTAQSAANGSSAMTRDLCDSRYAVTLSNVGTPSLGSISTDYVTAASLSLPAGLYSFNALITLFNDGGTGNIKSRLIFSNFSVGPRVTLVEYYGRANDTTVNINSYVSDNFTEKELTSTTGNEFKREIRGLIDIPEYATVSLQFAQIVANQTNAVKSRKRTYIIAQKID
jgi:hypothetical protein